MPDEMPEFTFEGEIGLATLLKEAGLVPSTSEAIRWCENQWRKNRRHESQCTKRHECLPSR